MSASRTLTQQIEEALLPSEDGLAFDPAKLNRLEGRFHVLARGADADAAGREVFEVLVTLQGTGHAAAVAQLVEVVIRVLRQANKPLAAGAFARFSGGVDATRSAPRLGQAAPEGSLSLRSMMPVGGRMRG